MTKHLAWAVLSVIVGTASAISQFGVTAGMTGMADDNVSNSYERGSDRITLFNLKPSYNWNTDATTTSLWYDGSFALYRNFADRTFQYHSVGITHTRIFGDEDAGTMEFAADYAARMNRESFTLFDHTTYGLAAAAEYYFTEKFAGATRYAFHTMTFAQHDGMLDMSSEIGKGTAFIVSLPPG
ncbi:MAG: hypothetical protein WCQ44_07370 [Opitutaceae bacterium]|jgi:hypothetical protein